MKSRVLSVFALCACASGDSGVRFNTASGYTVTPTSASVFGVFHDGRLDEHAWESYSRALSSFGRTCDARYTHAWIEAHEGDAKSIADDARQNGFSDDLFAKVASGAKGDAVLLLVVAGKPPVVLSREVRQRPVNPAQMTKPASTTYVHTVTDGNAFEITATIYSRKEHRSIAELDMTYGGQDLDEAMQRFADAFGKSFPGWTCAGWDE
jgi:hypothetical protein